jgi:hypothetical protein
VWPPPCRQARPRRPKWRSESPPENLLAKKVAPRHPLRRARPSHRRPLRRPHLASPHRIYQFRPSVLLLLLPPPTPPGSPCAGRRCGALGKKRRWIDTRLARPGGGLWGNEWGRGGNSLVISSNNKGNLVPRTGGAGASHDFWLRGHRMAPVSGKCGRFSRESIFADPLAGIQQKTAPDPKLNPCQTHPDFILRT